MQPKKPASYFPELKGEAQRLADEWLLQYLRLILRILRERDHVQRHDESKGAS